MTQSTPNTQGASWEEIEKILRTRDSKMYGYYKSVFEDDFEGGYPVEWDTEEVEAIRTLLSKERAEGERRGAEKERERLLGENSHLKRVSRAWDGVEADGQPNELVKAQIFGFRQAESILNEATLPADSTEDI